MIYLMLMLLLCGYAGYLAVGTLHLWLVWPWVSFLGGHRRGQLFCSLLVLSGWPIAWFIWANDVDNHWELPGYFWQLLTRRWSDFA